MARPKKQSAKKTAKKIVKKKKAVKEAPPPEPAPQMYRGIVYGEINLKWVREGEGAPKEEGSWKFAFLEHLSRTNRIYESCDVAGVSHQGMFLAKQSDPWFKSKYDEAQRKYGEFLVRVMEARAVIRSDYLLFKMVQAEMSEKYGDRTKMEMSGIMGSVNVQAGQEEMITERGREQLLQIISVLQKRLKEGQGASPPDSVTPPESSEGFAEPEAIPEEDHPTSQSTGC